jgi:hypothetical protein
LFVCWPRSEKFSVFAVCWSGKQRQTYKANKGAARKKTQGKTGETKRTELKQTTKEDERNVGKVIAAQRRIFLMFFVVRKKRIADEKEEEEE